MLCLFTTTALISSSHYHYCALIQLKLIISTGYESAHVITGIVHLSQLCQGCSCMQCDCGNTLTDPAKSDDILPIWHYTNTMNLNSLCCSQAGFHYSLKFTMYQGYFNANTDRDEKHICAALILKYFSLIHVCVCFYVHRDFLAFSWNKTSDGWWHQL